MNQHEAKIKAKELNKELPKNSNLVIVSRKYKSYWRLEYRWRSESKHEPSDDENQVILQAKIFNKRAQIDVLMKK